MLTAIHHGAQNRKKHSFNEKGYEVSHSNEQAMNSINAIQPKIWAKVMFQCVETNIQCAII